MKRKFLLALLAIATSILSGCANWSSIDRSTKLPPPNSDQKTRNTGVAIHLDMQQRLVLVNGLQEYCAEPSPDAIAAFAASAAASANVEQKVNGALAAAVGNNVSSTGLRTQSITLMRDSLYRMCEAYANGKISDIQVANLLARSQNMSMVILAIEQLTGAVTPKQASITTSANNQSAATLLSTQELLDKAREKENTAKAELDKANEALTDIPEDAENYTELTQNKELAQQKYDDAKANRELLEDNKDQIAANVSNSISGGVSYTTMGQTKQLDKEATQAIAKTISDMINKALDKDYTVETCLAYITSDNVNSNTTTADKETALYKLKIETYELCSNVLSTLTSSPEFNTIFGDRVAVDSSNAAINFREKYKSDPKFQEIVKEKAKTEGVSVNEFNTIREFSAERNKLYTEFN
ncbi:hypothetical protein SNR37_003156 [Agarivorans aestuarii]|uniref:Lipoprotein n=1 Tax=Agarivorans aestuarii TaxID=1563703 RepID=A0ABU7G405_9ALTE|nr:hypothetical protein [Agarivorans aestuarii]MEE1673729.1 hypothetical protein [Agarivorans aestuarii]